MQLTRYESGRRAEWAVKKMLHLAGAKHVLRSAGSKGQADLVALFDNATWAVQVKTYKPTAKEVEAVRLASEDTEARWALVMCGGGAVESVCYRKGKQYPARLFPLGRNNPQEESK